MLEKIFDLKIITAEFLREKTALLRVDLNVPLQNGQIADEFKLNVLLPTFNLIFKNATKCIILTHLGRPKGPCQELSTQNLLPWFAKNNLDVSFSRTIQEALSRSSKIIMLENLRFFSQEESPSQEFASELSALGEVFIFDAFGSIHRNATSINLLARQFDQKHRFIGPLVANELRQLYNFKESNFRPYTIVLGGSKLEKLELIGQLIDLDSRNRPDTILVGGFLAAWLLSSFEGLQVKLHLEQISSKKGVSLLCPVDFISLDDFGKAKVINFDEIEGSLQRFNLIDIGPKSISLFAEILDKSKKAFINGTMGKFEQKEAIKGTLKILNSMKNISNFGGMVGAGGGDCLRAIHEFGFSQNFGALSSGGGASLKFLATDFNGWKQFPGLLNFL